MQILTLKSGGFQLSAFSKGNARIALAGAILFAVFASSSQAALQSPKGAEVFGVQPVIPVPPKKTVTIGWSYPVHMETPDLVFKVYHSTDLRLPLREWVLLTNVPGNCRSTIVNANQPQEFFLMTASNYLGESNFATRD